jgi:hypothetical protein
MVRNPLTTRKDGQQRVTPLDHLAWWWPKKRIGTRQQAEVAQIVKAWIDEWAALGDSE